MDAETYEDLVADIVRQFFFADDLKIKRRAKLTGKSGHVHEIDVLVEFYAAGIKFLVLIECKYWNSHVGAQQVMVLSERIADLGAHKGILVTFKGFEKGAIIIAKSKGIALVKCGSRENVANAAILVPNIIENPNDNLWKSFIVNNRDEKEDDIDSRKEDRIKKLASELMRSKYTYSLLGDQNSPDELLFPVLVMHYQKTLTES